MINNIDFLYHTTENDFKMWLKQKLFNYVPQKVRYYKNDLKNKINITRTFYELPKEVTKSGNIERFYYNILIYPHGKNKVDIYIK
mgnify:CR=1 FL=1